MPASEILRARVETCALRGVQAIPVQVELEISSGLPGMHIVGMADAAVQEARQRVRSSVRAAGFRMPSEGHMVVNLAPASVRKTGSGFDLPIAVAYLLATKQIDPKLVENTLAVGELALEGSVRAVDGLFAYALCANKQGKRLLSGLPMMRLPELEDFEHLCIEHLVQLRSGRFQKPNVGLPKQQVHAPDFSDVVGQTTAVRALTIAAAGAHGALLVGPPGSGKSMLARRLPSILPPLNVQECIEAALVHSVAGLDVSSIASGIRPFRSPHHSASTASLVGGGSRLMPGEASLANHGVLFLDELGEFKTDALQALRQPIEDGYVTLARADGRAVFPAKFQLLAASNPCPCGYLGDREHHCTCSELQINRYKSKLGGPLKDRIDLICEVSRIDPSKVMSSGSGKTSAELATSVMAARERAEFRGQQPVSLAAATPFEVIEECGLKSGQKKLVEEMARTHCLSGRGIIRVLRVARTIADLEQSDAVSDDHLYEAFMYRVENTLE